jgi:hypothetical protein
LTIHLETVIVIAFAMVYLVAATLATVALVNLGDCPLGVVVGGDDIYALAHELTDGGTERIAVLKVVVGLELSIEFPIELFGKVKVLGVVVDIEP